MITQLKVLDGGFQHLMLQFKTGRCRNVLVKLWSQNENISLCVLWLAHFIVSICTISSCSMHAFENLKVLHCKIQREFWKKEPQQQLSNFLILMASLRAFFVTSKQKFCDLFQFFFFTFIYYLIFQVFYFQSFIGCPQKNALYYCLSFIKQKYTSCSPNFSKTSN